MECPSCGEQIKDGALKCKYCREFIGPVAATEARSRSSDDVLFSLAADQPQMTGRARQALWVVAAFLALKSVLASWSNPASDPLHAFVIYAPTSIVTAWFAWTFYRRMPLAVGVGLVIAILELIDAAFGAFNAFDPALP